VSSATIERARTRVSRWVLEFPRDPLLGYAPVMSEVSALPDRPVASAAPIASQGRIEYHPPRAVTRQLAWTASAIPVAALLSLAGLHTGSVTFFAVVAAAGLAAAYPSHILRSLHLLVGLLFAGLTANASGLEPGLWMAAVTGAVATWYARGALEPWRMVNGALVGFAGAALMSWLLSILLPASPFPTVGFVSAIATAAFYAFGVSQTIWLDGVTWRRLDSIPSKRRIRNTLSLRYRDPSFKAWHIDRVVRTLAPDRETREGLMEVGAWVYRLSWALQSLDKELGLADEVDLGQRIAHLEQKITTDTDTFVRERHKAAVQHLLQTKEHRNALAIERDRTGALLDYALAFLEEARAGLAVARIQPGHEIPERLHDVLGRLRSYAHERNVERTTAAEVGIL
jgi:hypothetical protein